MATIFTVLGTMVSAVGTIAAGAAAARAANAQAAQQEHAARVADQKAMQERALAQRAAFEKRREGRLATSTLVARAAASGTSATDPTIIKLGGDIAGRSEYLALSDMARGEQAGRDQEDRAALNRWQAGIARDEAGNAMTSGFLRAGSSILSGANSLFGRYSGAQGGGFVGLRPLTGPAGPSSSIFNDVNRTDPWSHYYG
jgi:hypothetical protein